MLPVPNSLPFYLSAFGGGEGRRVGYSCRPLSFIRRGQGEVNSYDTKKYYYFLNSGLSNTACSAFLDLSK